MENIAIILLLFHTQVNGVDYWCKCIVGGGEKTGWPRGKKQPTVVPIFFSGSTKVVDVVINFLDGEVLQNPVSLPDLEKVREQW